MSEKNEEIQSQALAKVEGAASTAMAIYKSLSDIREVAKIAAQSRLFGTDDVSKTTILMLRAHADGVNPIYAPTRYHIIKDKVSMAAEAMLAEFQNSGGKIEWEEHSAERCAGTFSHPRGNTVTASFSLDDAKKAGLLGKDNWKGHTEDMLHARAVSRGVRWSYPQATQGLYTPEEIEDMQHVAPAVTATPTDPTDAQIDTRPKADRLADKLGGTATVPGTPEVLNATDIEHEDVPAPAAAETIDTERDSHLSAIKTLRDAIGPEEYRKCIKAFGTGKTSDLDNDKLEELLTALEKREQEIKHEKFVAGAGAPPAQSKSGESLEHADMRKRFFAVAKERFGKGFNHHEIIGESCSLSEMSTEDIERAILMIEAGEFDHLKN
jgi:hypothetical protein